ncbi:MAG: hypothetical protein IKR07_05660 [Oscillospiraceae bacterium]|nr:hypothetical protein [Oscillospiraceae bacterium]
MHKSRCFLAALLVAAVCMSGCGGKQEETPEPISVQAALETVEENLGRSVCVRGYPVAFFYSYTYSGAKVFSIYFADTPAEFYGEIETVEEVNEAWVEAIVHEDNELWKSVKDVFDGKRETEEYLLLLKGAKSRITGAYYYDFLEIR